MVNGLAIQDARDAVYGIFLAAMNAYAPGVNDGELPLIYWDNVDPQQDRPVDKPWMRVSMRHTSGGQTSMGGVGNRDFERNGVVTVQVFVPAGARGLALADQLSKIALDAFEGKESNGVWFRNVTYREAGRTEAWFQINVTAEFTYEQTK